MKKFASFLAVFLLITLCAAASESGDRDIPAEVAQLTDSLKKQFAPDKRVALLEIDYSFSGKNVMLRGVTTSAEAKTVLLKELAKKGYTVMDCLKVLPDGKDLEGKTYGIINVSVANLRVSPDFSSEMMTQGLMGNARACVAARRLDTYSNSRRLYRLGAPRRCTSRDKRRNGCMEQCGKGCSERLITVLYIPNRTRPHRRFRMLRQATV